jgi:hypothetical protein
MPVEELMRETSPTTYSEAHQQNAAIDESSRLETRNKRVLGIG